MWNCLNSNGIEIGPPHKPGNMSGFCRGCEKKLQPVVGSIDPHYWRHYPKESCDYDPKNMGEWHTKWQLLYQILGAKTEQTVGHKRADVVYNSRIIELQHSSISQEKILGRCNNATENGYFITWIFDRVEKYLDNKIQLKGNGLFEARSSPSLNVLYHSSGYPCFGEVYYDISGDYSELQRITKNLFNGNFLSEPAYLEDINSKTIGKIYTIHSTSEAVAKFRCALLEDKEFALQSLEEDYEPYRLEEIRLKDEQEAKRLGEIEREREEKRLELAEIVNQRRLEKGRRDEQLKERARLKKEQEEREIAERERADLFEELNRERIQKELKEKEVLKRIEEERFRLEEERIDEEYRVTRELEKKRIAAEQIKQHLAHEKELKEIEINKKIERVKEAEKEKIRRRIRIEELSKKLARQNNTTEEYNIKKRILDRYPETDVTEMTPEQIIVVTRKIENSLLP